MKQFIPLLLFLPILLTGCKEDVSQFELPVIEGQFVRLTVGGEEHVYERIGPEGDDLSAFYPDSQRPGVRSSLLIQRYRQGGLFDIQVNANDLPVDFGKDGVATVTNEAVRAWVYIRGRDNAMTGSLYCPHEQSTGSHVTYEGLLTIDSWSRDNRIRGTFTVTEAEDFAQNIEDVHFDIVVPIR